MHNLEALHPQPHLQPTPQQPLPALLSFFRLLGNVGRGERIAGDVVREAEEAEEDVAAARGR